MNGLTNRFDFLEVSDQPVRARFPVHHQTCLIAGTTYREDIETIEPMLSIGMTLVLEPEPHNPYDQLAIQVKTLEGHFLGYIPRKQNAELAQWIHQGGQTQVRLIEKGWQRDWLQLKIEVNKICLFAEQAA